IVIIDTFTACKSSITVQVNGQELFIKTGKCNNFTTIRKSKLIKFSVKYLCKSEIKTIFKSRTEDIWSSLFLAYARYYLLKFSLGERKEQTFESTAPGSRRFLQNENVYDYCLGRALRIGKDIFIKYMNGYDIV
ncbi:unnamed protein product, partial [Trichogramma brassicae]